MSTVKVTIDLPFFLRLEDSVSVPYDEVCKESQIPELKKQDIQITFSHIHAGSIDKSNWPHERTTVAITLEAPKQLPNDSVNTFAIQNCLEILNRVITSYQATTGEVSNAGFIFSLGTSDMQLFADIRVNGQNIRDRWPLHNSNSFPLPNSKMDEFRHYLTGQDDLPLSSLFLTNAVLSLERGQYPLAVFQAAAAVELRITQVIRGKLKAAGWSDQAIEPYEKMTLGGKLQISQTDPRSLETYFDGVSGFADVYKKAKDNLTWLRNHVAHRGYLASHKDAKLAVQIARDFLAIVN
ncbi:MAG: hypothetical protein HYU86_06455 [Chloroflexi bacterium]|nr:hypothetical protein [Chloroflexota bacterium]